MSKFSSSVAFALLLLCSSTSYGQLLPAGKPAPPTLFSQTSIEKGWASAVQTQQPMLVMFTSENCRYCKKMLAETYGHPAIQRMLTGRAQTVLASAEDYEGLVKKLGIRGYPSSVLVSPKGDVLELVEGFLPPLEFAKRVHPALNPQTQQTRAAQLPQRTAER